MKIKMQFSGKWFFPVILCDGCGRVIERLADGMAYYNSKLRTGEPGKVYFAHVLGRCGCVVDEQAKADNQDRDFFLHPIPIDAVLLDVLKELSPQFK